MFSTRSRDDLQQQLGGCLPSKQFTGEDQWFSKEKLYKVGMGKSADVLLMMAVLMRMVVAVLMRMVVIVGMVVVLNSARGLHGLVWNSAEV